MHVIGSVKNTYNLIVDMHSASNWFEFLNMSLLLILRLRNFLMWETKIYNV